MIWYKSVLVKASGASCSHTISITSSSTPESAKLKQNAFKELVQLYVEGLCEDDFYSDNYTMKYSFAGYDDVIHLEYKLKRASNKDRVNNPEFQEALKIMQSPLMKALL